MFQLIRLVNHVDTELNKKAALVSPAFTGTATAVNLTVSGSLINGTTNVLTSLNSKATTADLALKAPIASPTFTGTVLGITKAMVDLANVDNTTDALKPVSAATTTQLNLRTDKTTTDNSAVAWSAGLTSDAYHYLNTGTDALVVRTGSGAISANFLGSAGGASYDGTVYS